MLRFDAAHSIVLRTGIPKGWREAAVGDIVQIIGGGTPDREQTEYWRDGKIPWITPTDLTANRSKYISSGAENISELGLNNSNARLVPTGSIVFSTRGTVGNLGLAAVPLTSNQSCEILLPKNGEMEGEFLYYLLHFGMSAFIRLSGGTTFGAITRPDIARVRFAFPKTSHERAAIAHILDAVDSAIERTREAVRSAHTLRKSLLVDLLTYGIGSNGHLRDAARSPSEFVQTPLGRLPSDWRISFVGKEFDLQNGFTLNQNRRRRNRKRGYLRVANVQRDRVDLRSIKELDASDAEFLPRILNVDDLLVVEGHADRLQIGRCARVPKEAEGLTFQNHLFRLRANGEIISQFACLWLNSAYAQKYWNARCGTSSGLNTINQRMLKALFIPVPSKQEQKTISRIVGTHRAQLEGLTSKLDRLLALKNSLMHDLLAGKVRLATRDLKEISKI